MAGAATTLLWLPGCDASSSIAAGAAAGVLAGGLATWFALRGRASQPTPPAEAPTSTNLEIAQDKALDGAGLLIARLENDRIVAFNRECEAVTGRSASEVLGTELGDLLVPESHAEALQRTLVSARAGETTARFPWCTAAGERRIIEWRLIPVGDTGTTGLLLCGTDRTGVLDSERELVTLRAHSSTAFDGGPFGLVTLDRDGRLVEMNRGACEIFGGTWPPPSVDTPAPINLRTDPAAPELAAAVTTALGGTSARVSLPEVPALGPTVGWFQIDVVPIARETGELYGVSLICQCLTAQRAAEAAIRESSDRLRFLMENLREMVVVVQDGRFTYVSEGCRRLLGYEPPDVTDKSLQGAIVPEHRERIRVALMEGLRSGATSVGSHEFQMIRKSGQRIWVELRPQIATWQGRTAIVGVLSNITHRRMADEQLRFQASILEHLTEWVVVTDPTGRITWVSPSLERSFELPRRDVVGRPVEEALTRLRLRDGHMEDIAREAVTRGHWSGTFTVDMKRGTIIVDTGVSAMRDELGDIVALIGVGRDVTAHTALETQLRQAQKMEAIGQLAGGIAHDFNNILVAIKGYSQLAGGQLPPEDPIRADLEQIDDAARRASELTRQLLAFGRREPSRPRTVDLNEALVAFAPMLQRMIGEQVQLSLQLAAKVATVRIDSNQVELALMNLVANARDAMDGRGTVIVRTETLDVDGAVQREHNLATPGKHVVVSVVDTGSGMAPEVRDKVFEPFFTTKELGRGTGLGLSTVYGIVSQNGGFIELDSRVGEGTTFRLVFPAVEERPTRAVRPVAQAEGGAETVLIAEDEPQVLRLARRVMSNAGYQVLTATNGREAVEVFQAHADEISLVVLDVVMPEMGGRQAYELMRTWRADVPALFCSGYSVGEIHTDFIVNEGIQLLSKPYSPADLLTRARAVLDENRTPGEGAPGPDPAEKTDGTSELVAGSDATGSPPNG